MAIRFAYCHYAHPALWLKGNLDGGFGRCNFTSLRSQKASFGPSASSGQAKAQDDKKLIMAEQRIDKKFKLSDSSLNSYGMKMLTSGYDMAEFKKNPIGYYRHDDKDGVLLKWDGLALEGDHLVGYPIINLSHPRAERTINEINDGFLNAASVGRLKILEFHLEDNAADESKPIVVVTKWYNKEASIAENPSNNNASALALCDKDDNEINLEDLYEIPKIKISKSKDMNKRTVPVTAEMLELLNLEEGATDDAISEGIKNLKTERDEAVNKLTSEKKALAAKRVKEIADKGLEEKKYTAATRDKLVKQFGAFPDQLEDLVKDMQPIAELKVNERDANPDGFPTELEDKSLDQLRELGKLAYVRDNFPAKYKELYKKRHGEEPPKTV